MTAPTLWPTQAAALAAAADGASLTTVAARIGRPRPAVASLLSRAYRQLGVDRLPREQRRAAAIRVARQHGLIPPAEGDQQ